MVPSPISFEFGKNSLRCLKYNLFCFVPSRSSKLNVNNQVSNILVLQFLFQFSFPKIENRPRLKHLPVCRNVNSDGPQTYIYPNTSSTSYRKLIETVYIRRFGALPIFNSQGTYMHYMYMMTYYVMWWSERIIFRTKKLIQLKYCRLYLSFAFSCYILYVPNVPNLHALATRWYTVNSRQGVKHWVGCKQAHIQQARIYEFLITFHWILIAQILQTLASRSNFSATLGTSVLCTWTDIRDWENLSEW